MRNGRAYGTDPQTCSNSTRMGTAKTKQVYQVHDASIAVHTASICTVGRGDTKRGTTRLQVILEPDFGAISISRVIFIQHGRTRHVRTRHGSYYCCTTTVCVLVCNNKTSTVVQQHASDPLILSILALFVITGVYFEVTPPPPPRVLGVVYVLCHIPVAFRLAASHRCSRQSPLWVPKHPTG